MGLPPVPRTTTSSSGKCSYVMPGMVLDSTYYPAVLSPVYRRDYNRGCLAHLRRCSQTGGMDSSRIACGQRETYLSPTASCSCVGELTKTVMRKRRWKDHMDVKGNQKVKAPRQQVFQALLNPEVLKNSVPGCEGAEFVDFPTGRQLKMTISPGIPGLKGPFTVFLQTGEVVPPSRVVLIAEPTSSVGSVHANCVIDLTDDPEGTNLSYNAKAKLEGKIAATPELIAKGFVKSALEHFFKNFEKQVSTANV